MGSREQETKSQWVLPSLHNKEVNDREVSDDLNLLGTVIVYKSQSRDHVSNKYKCNRIHE